MPYFCQYRLQRLNIFNCRVSRKKCNLALEVMPPDVYNLVKVMGVKTGRVKMSKGKRVYFMTVALLAGLVGCGREYEISGPEPICVRTVDKGRVMEIAEDVLVRMNFVVEKYDAKAGFIRTKPLRAGQIFEFWRRDNVGPAATAEANLHSIRRQVRLDISESDDQVFVKCGVGIERLSLPEKEIIGVAQLGGMFTNSGRSRQRLRLNVEQQRKMAWIDLGSDAALERKILTLIEKKYKKLEGPG